MRDFDLSPVGLILLAAGGSRRLGTPKQLLPDGEGKTLVRRAARTALASACRPIVAVLGASAEPIAAELDDLPLTVAVNPAWQTGLASSLKAGLTALTNNAPPSAVIVMLCDQPMVTSALLDALIAAYQATSHEIVACEYNGIMGVPALFGQTLFGALMSLTGDEGARRVIKNYDGPITCIPFPEGSLDIDTPQDANALLGAGSVPSLD